MPGIADKFTRSAKRQTAMAGHDEDKRVVKRKDRSRDRGFAIQIEWRRSEIFVCRGGLELYKDKSKMP
jgi:hypothetical protein